MHSFFYYEQRRHVLYNTKMAKLTCQAQTITWHLTCYHQKLHPVAVLISQDICFWAWILGICVNFYKTYASTSKCTQTHVTQNRRLNRQYVLPVIKIGAAIAGGHENSWVKPKYKPVKQCYNGTGVHQKIFPTPVNFSNRSANGRSRKFRAFTYRC